MRDVSEVHERLFREGDSDTKVGAFRTKFWRETKMAGIAKSTIADENGGMVEEWWKNGGRTVEWRGIAKSRIADVHVEALRRGAFLRLRYFHILGPSSSDIILGVNRAPIFT